MKKENKIEIARNILNNATNINMNKGIILKISQKVDKYIVEHYQKDPEKNKLKRSYGDTDEREII
ncbi:MAG: Spo0E family sporulation regulatory protein-aspartic acid phosphatase [Bacillota bacterium]|nr:Spo0E family sporulation regulatory protein-aspartic acid phosphatase [Bacillota bacterium]